jgi:hypothetical protein
VTQDKFQKILALAGEQDKAELGLAHNARIDALNKYQKNPGRDTKNNLDAAREFYDETVERLWPVYFPDDAGTPEGETFRNKKAAFDWIVGNHGNIVSVGKFYQDCGNGNPTVYENKTVSKFSVLEYVLKQKAKNGGSGTGVINPDYAAMREKADAEKSVDDARIARVKADEAERERDAKWMLREDHGDEMAAFAGLAEDIFRHRVYLDHALLYRVARESGEAEFAHGLQGFVDRGFNDIANYKEIDIEFEAEEESEA